jgi:hypothetical protein
MLRPAIFVGIGSIFRTALLLVRKHANGPLGANDPEMVMTDSTSSETDRETATRSTVIPLDPAAAYVLGYGDCRLLMSGQSEDSLRPIRARFLAHVEPEHPSAAEHAYVAGVRAAAADNLPSPPTEPYRDAA